MPVPDFQSFMLPMLKGCADNQQHTLKQFRTILSGIMGIPQEDVQKDMLPSGTQTRYENHIYWAAIYLHRAGCLERVGRGVSRSPYVVRESWRISQRKFTISLLNQFSEFRAFHRPKTSASSNGIITDSSLGEAIEDSQTPEEHFGKQLSGSSKLTRKRSSRQFKKRSPLEARYRMPGKQSVKQAMKE
jgi:restriction system protein